MYLDVHDINEIIDIYTAAWDKGLKTTYYLHVKPKHTAEQSTTRVNKSEAMGKKGFAGLFQAAAKPVEDAPVVSPLSDMIIEEKVTIVEEVVTVAQAAPVAEMKAAASAPEPIKKQKAAFTPLSELSQVAKPLPATAPAPKQKVTIHGPEDPMDALLCEGCQ